MTKRPADNQTVGGIEALLRTLASLPQMFGLFLSQQQIVVFTTTLGNRGDGATRGDQGGCVHTMSAPVSHVRTVRKSAKWSRGRSTFWKRSQLDLNGSFPAARWYWWQDDFWSLSLLRRSMADLGSFFMRCFAFSLVQLFRPFASFTSSIARFVVALL